MSERQDTISPAQAEISRQVFNAGNGQLASTLGMIFSDTPGDVDVQSKMVSPNDLPRAFGHDPLCCVRVRFEGDIVGTFLMLQSEKDFEGTRKALSEALGAPVHTEGQATDYLVPDWLQQRRAESVDDRKISDALSELGNVLLGSYLTAIYSKSGLATFQDLPESRLDDAKQEWLNEAVDAYRNQSTLAFLAEVSCTVRKHPLRFSLVMIAAQEGLREMIEALSD